MVEDDGAHMINFCTDCFNLTQGERKEPVMNNKQWKAPVAERRSRGKWWAGYTASKNKMWVAHSPPQDAAMALNIGHKMDGGDAVRRRSGVAAGKQRSASAWYEERSGRDERTTGGSV